MTTSRPRGVIIGAGFGGMRAARALERKPVDVVLIDRNNYHTFTPLLYQVATSALDPSEIAYPVRTIFQHVNNVDSLMGQVTAVDVAHQQVTVETSEGLRRESYDYLIIAAGSTTNFFNLDPTNPLVFELKTLQDAIELRNHVLNLFEQAAWTNDIALRRALTTIVVAGGGPTGLETAGALHELFNDVLHKEFHELKDLDAQVFLVEANANLLAQYPERLQRAALWQLESLGVHAIFNNPVVAVTKDCIRLKNGREILAHTLVWTAGVQASCLAKQLKQPLYRNGRIAVKPTMEVEGVANVYAVGDMAYLEDRKGVPYPMLAAVAQQQGTCAARNILRRESGKMQKAFAYFDRGVMATIGPSRAVAWIFNRIQLTGLLAWFAWLGLHIILLMGFRNRLVVLVNWFWDYVTYSPAARIITESSANFHPAPTRRNDESGNLRSPVAKAEQQSAPLSQ